jgi:hypothetical protein
MNISGTKVQLASNLQKAISPNLTRDEIIKLVNEYWDHVDNKAARTPGIDAETLGRHIADMMSNAEPFLPKATEKAKTNRYYYDALRVSMLSIIESGVELTENHRNALLVLLANERPKDKRKSKPEVFQKNYQLALCVNALIAGTNNKFSLTSPDKNKNLDNVFEIVHEATGESIDCVHLAYRDKTLKKMICRHPQE